MRTRSEIESIVTSAYVGSERQSKVTDALLEVMMDIRDALLDPVGTTSTYNTAAKEYAENMTKVAEIQKIEEAQPSGHPGWTCDDAHPNLTHEKWANGDYLAEVVEAVAEIQDPYGTMEGNEEGENGVSRTLYMPSCRQA